MGILIFIIVFASLLTASFFVYKKMFGGKENLDAKAKTILKSKNPEKAIKHLKLVITKTKDNEEKSNLHEILGDVYFSLLNYSSAVIEYKNAISFGFNTTKRRLSLAKALAKSGGKKIALYEYAEILKEDKDSHEVYYQIGIIYFENYQYSIAYDYFQKALKLNRNFEVATKYKGITASFMNNYEEAIEVLEPISNDNKNDSLLQWGLANAYRIQCDYSKAITHYKLAKLDLIDNDRILFEESLCHIALADIESAIETLDLSLKFHPTNVDLILITKYTLAECYENTGSTENTIKLLEDISLIDNNYKDVAEKLEKYQNYRYTDAIISFFNGEKEEFTDKALKLTSTMQLNPYMIQYTAKDSLVIFSKESTNVHATIKMVYIRKLFNPITIIEMIALSKYNQKNNILKCSIVTAAISPPEVIRYAEISHIEIISIKAIENLIQKSQSSSVKIDDIKISDEVLKFEE